MAHPLTDRRMRWLAFQVAAERELELLREERALRTFNLPTTIRRVPSGMSHDMVGNELGRVALTLAEEP